MSRACDILDQATGVIKTSKVLYLSQVNLLKHLEGLGLIQGEERFAQSGKQRTFVSRVTKVFERALFESDLIALDKKDVGIAYVDYIREVATDVAQVKAVQTKLRDVNILNILPMNAATNGA